VVGLCFQIDNIFLMIWLSLTWSTRPWNNMFSLPSLKPHGSLLHLTFKCHKVGSTLLLWWLITLIKSGNIYGMLKSISFRFTRFQKFPWLNNWMCTCFGPFDKFVTYVKDEGASLNTLIIALRRKIVCFIDVNVATYYEHAMSKCC
jgi:hypothetical protein